MWKRLAYLILLTAAPMPALSAGQWQDLDSIRQGAIEFARSQTADLTGEISVSATPLDSRLLLPACPAMEFFVPAGNRLWGSSNVGARCGAPSVWTVYVPVMVKVSTEIVFASHPLNIGQKLTPADVQIKRDDITQFAYGAISDPAQAMGKTLTASVPAGYPLRQDMLRAPYVIQQGQTVKVVARGQGFQVNSEGKAQGNAAAGQLVSVRLSSGKMVKGTATDGGYVEVPF